jgi:hypothetical protein
MSLEVLDTHTLPLRGAYLGQEKTKEDCAGMKADKRRLKLADFERGCVPLQNQLLSFCAAV